MNRRNQEWLIILLLILLMACSQQTQIEVGKKTEVDNEKAEKQSTPSLEDLDKLMDEILTVLSEETTSNQPIRYALSLLETLISQSPQHAYAIRLRASLFLQIKEDEKAARTYQTYLSLYPKDSNTRITLANLYHKLGLTKQFEDQIDQIFLMEPDTWIPYELMAELAKLKGNNEGYKINKEKAIDLKSQGKPAKPSLVFLNKYLSPHRNRPLNISLKNHSKPGGETPGNSKLKPLKSFLE